MGLGKAHLLGWLDLAAPAQVQRNNLPQAEVLATSLLAVLAIPVEHPQEQTACLEVALLPAEGRGCGQGYLKDSLVAPTRIRENPLRRLGPHPDGLGVSGQECSRLVLEELRRQKRLLQQTSACTQHAEASSESMGARTHTQAPRIASLRKTRGVGSWPESVSR
mmetsp:Transcript_105390/g.187407  ORF Transcript_105390/g.187407 Transcript_105390/m.187407 type:complete len:164 (-) Transcript_105390:77-568(-)